MLRLPIVLLLIAVVSSLVHRTLRRVGLLAAPTVAPPTVGAPTKVLLATSVRGPWHEAIVHLLSQAHEPRALRFAALLECTRPSDADVGELGSDLRPVARLVHARARSAHPVHRLRRLARRFVEGDEGLVVVIDARARVVRGWDTLLASALASGSGGRRAAVVLSAPAASTREGVPAFPTRRMNSSGRAARGLARRQEGQPAPVAMPSVCWCAELTAARPAALRAWLSAHPKETTSAVALTEGCAVRHRVPAFALVEDDPALEADCRAADGGSADAACGAHERVGLTHDGGDAQRITKFGSSRAARLAVEFA
jgi:hypothetical protein